MSLRSMQMFANLTKAARVLKNEGPVSLMRKVGSAMGRSACAGHSAQVLFVNGCGSDTPHPARYRVARQIEQLELAGVTCAQVCYEELTIQHIDSAKTVVFFRCPITDLIREAIIHAHELGQKVYFDVDDLVVDTSYTDELPFVRSMDSESKKLFDDGVMRNRETLRLCDAAIVSTGCLAEEISKYVGEVLINRNVASQEMVALSTQALKAKTVLDDNRITLGYFSESRTHDTNFALISDALEWLLDARPHVSLMLVGLAGVPDNLMRFSDRIFLHDLVDWRNLPSLMASVDVNLAPLEDTAFNRGRSEDKWIDASLVGIPTIASNVGAFAEMLQNGTTGYLCSKQDEWEAALIECVDCPDKRFQIAERARRFCLARCTTFNTGRWLACKLTGEPFTLGSLLPREEAERDGLVSKYLAGYGIHEIDALPSLQLWDTVAFERRFSEYIKACNDGKKCAILLYESTCGDSSTFRYFGYNVWQALLTSDEWHAGFFFVDEIPHAVSLLEYSQVVVLIRMRIRPDVVSFVNEAHSRDIPVAFLIDDLVVGEQTASRVIKTRSIASDDELGKAFWRGLTRRFDQMARLSDCFIAPVPRLASLLSQRYGMPSVLIHNALNDEQVRVSDSAIRSIEANRTEKVPFTIAYFSGTDSHTDDFALVEGAIIRFLAERDDARLLLVGHLRLSQEMYYLFQEGKLLVLPVVDYATLQSLQASADVSLAPVVLDEFTNCKSALKVFESGVVKTPACASPSDSYTEAIDEGVTGFLCDDSNDWYRALCVLYEMGDERRRMGSEARNKALNERHGAAVRREIECAFDTIADYPVRAVFYEGDEIMTEVASRSLNWDDQLQINPLYGGLRH